LNLSATGFRGTLDEEIEDALSYNDILNALNLNNNKYYEGSGLFMRGILRNNKGLTEFHVRNCFTTEDDV
jgi:hypothetical protein